MEISIIIVIVFIILVAGVAYVVNYVKRPMTDLEIDQSKLNKAYEIIKHNKEIAESSQKETEAFIKDKLKKTDEMLKK